ncbi:GGDEF domain-containing protein [Patescibacteria group bacterium]|nr:GGDEF domain-containing protein [Patescibacteria group bacterium]MBU1907140.1 GGDEF domain-containing protein [Patescibacteria group bacterium]
MNQSNCADVIPVFTGVPDEVRRDPNYIRDTVALLKQIEQDTEEPIPTFAVVALGEDLARHHGFLHTPPIRDIPIGLADEMMAVLRMSRGRLKDKLTALYAPGAQGLVVFPAVKRALTVRPDGRISVNPHHIIWMRADVNYLNLFNDTDHELGDRALQLITGTMFEWLNTGNSIGVRQSHGDEFLVLVPDVDMPWVHNRAFIASMRLAQERIHPVRLPPQASYGLADLAEGYAVMRQIFAENLIPRDEITQSIRATDLIADFGCARHKVHERAALLVTMLRIDPDYIHQVVGFLTKDQGLADFDRLKWIARHDESEWHRHIKTLTRDWATRKRVEMINARDLIGKHDGADERLRLACFEIAMAHFDGDGPAPLSVLVDDLVLIGGGDQPVDPDGELYTQSFAEYASNGFPPVDDIEVVDNRPLLLLVSGTHRAIEALPDPDEEDERDTERLRDLARKIQSA